MTLKIKYLTESDSYPTQVKQLMRGNSLFLNATIFANPSYLSAIDNKEMDFEPFFVFVQDEIVIGYIHLNWFPCAEYAVIEYCVKDSYRKKGIGSKLLQHAIKCAKAKNIKYLSADTFNNTASEKCLTKNGFKKIGVYPNRYNYFDGEQKIYINKTMWILNIDSI